MPFKDGDECIVYLKDRLGPPVDASLEDEMVQWYSRAFGEERNIMSLQFTFSPGTAIKMQARYFVELTFEPFPEMEDEDFPSWLRWQKHQVIEMEETGEDSKIWTLDLKRPYGEFKANCKYKLKIADDDDTPLEDLPNEQRKNFAVHCTPKPISAAEQERRDNEEEEEIKKNE